MPALPFEKYMKECIVRVPVVTLISICAFICCFTILQPIWDRQHGTSAPHHHTAVKRQTSPVSRGSAAVPELANINNAGPAIADPRLARSAHARLQLRYRWGHLVTGDWTGSETQSLLLSWQHETSGWTPSMPGRYKHKHHRNCMRAWFCLNIRHIMKMSVRNYDTNCKLWFTFQFKHDIIVS